MFDHAAHAQWRHVVLAAVHLLQSFNRRVERPQDAGGQQLRVETANTRRKTFTIKARMVRIKVFLSGCVNTFVSVHCPVNKTLQRNTETLLQTGETGESYLWCD